MSRNWWGWGHQWGPLEARPSGQHCWKVPCCQPHWQPVYTVSEAWRKRASQNSKQSTIAAKRHAYRHTLTNFYDTDTDTQLDTPTDTFTAITTHTNNRIHTPKLGPTPPPTPFSSCLASRWWGRSDAWTQTRPWGRCRTLCRRPRGLWWFHWFEFSVLEIEEGEGTHQLRCYRLHHSER